MRELDITQEFAYAFDRLEHSDRHIFLTGRAGTGKSTLLQYFRNSTKKRVAVLAPTGVAAINVQGQTIHSFFNFRPDVSKEAIHRIKMRKEQRRLYRNLDAIVIDEISMVRADLLDFVDEFLRMHGPEAGKPFGGVQMVFIGDLYQLPPVLTRQEQDIFVQKYETPFFFSAKAFEEIDMDTIELQTIYRQKDPGFIDILNAVRTNTITPLQMNELNQRLDTTFVPDDDDFCIYLTTTNKIVDEINQLRLNEVSGEPIYCYGEIDGQFEGRSMPTHQELLIKKGAQVMMLNNDSMGRWINGSVGIIVDVLKEYDEPVIRVELDVGETVDVTPHTWETYEYHYDEDEDAILTETVGTFRQYPLKLAWAVTVHKAQGKTFPRVVLDVGRGMFAHGQMYVALSRCTTLEGIILKRPIFRSHIIMDPRVVNFMKRQNVLIPVLE